MRGTVVIGCRRSDFLSKDSGAGAVQEVVRFNLVLDPSMTTSPLARIDVKKHRKCVLIVALRGESERHYKWAHKRTFKMKRGSGLREEGH